MSFPTTASYFELFPAFTGNELATDGATIVRHVKHVNGRKQTLGWFHSTDGSVNFEELEDHVEHDCDTLEYHDRLFKRAARLSTNCGRVILHPSNKDKDQALLI